MSVPPVGSHDQQEPRPRGVRARPLRGSAGCRSGRAGGCASRRRGPGADPGRAAHGAGPREHQGPPAREAAANRPGARPEPHGDRRRRVHAAHDVARRSGRQAHVGQPGVRRRRLQVPARGRCRARRRDRGRRQRLVPRAAAGHAVRRAGPWRRADRHLLGRFVHVRREPAGLHVRGHARAPAPRRRAAVPPGRGLAGRRRGCRARRAVRRGRRLAAGGDAAHRHPRGRGRLRCPRGSRRACASTTRLRRAARSAASSTPAGRQRPGATPRLR